MVCSPCLELYLDEHEIEYHSWRVARRRRDGDKIVADGADFGHVALCEFLAFDRSVPLVYEQLQLHAVSISPLMIVSKVEMTKMGDTMTASDECCLPNVY